MEYIDYILISPFLAVFVYVSLGVRNPMIYFRRDSWRPVFRLSRWKKLSFSTGEIVFTMFVLIFSSPLVPPLYHLGFGRNFILALTLTITIIPFMCLRHIIITDSNKND